MAKTSLTNVLRATHTLSPPPLPPRPLFLLSSSLQSCCETAINSSSCWSSGVLRLRMSGAPINGNLAVVRLSYGSNCRRPRSSWLALHLQPKRRHPEDFTNQVSSAFHFHSSTAIRRWSRSVRLKWASQRHFPQSFTYLITYLLKFDFYYNRGGRR